MSEKEPKEGDLRLRWATDAPKDPYLVDVASVEEAVIVFDTLAFYDLHLEARGILSKDGWNESGLEIFYDGEWVEWEDRDGYSFREWMLNREEK